ncbi:MAG: glycogen synthase [Deltaproteobacteria bacterium]|jgi:starch synthase|nr:glycogen synthase [Deltaproteobacteria bacterium]
MQVFFITPEAVPCSRAGGLGDVSYFLPGALAKLGHNVTVIVPKYRGAEEFNLKHLGELTRTIDLSISRRQADFYELKIADGHRMLLVDSPDLFDRPGIYGNEFGDYDDNAERFIFFSKAVFSILKELSDENQDTVVHAHDWPSGLVPMFVRVYAKKEPEIRDIGTVFTYHNLENQGNFPYYDFTMTGLDWSHFTFQGLEFHGQLNLTKAGLIGAHLISTVSHRYARETLSPELGKGLEGLLKERHKNIRSVLHGVDYKIWDPEKDKLIKKHYGIEDLSGKKECRAHLLTLFGLDESDLPVVAVISRLLPRKGLDLIVKAMPTLLTLPLKFIFMGTGEDQYISFLRETARDNPTRVGLKLAYDPPLMHHILSGADIFLNPSRFEPCGLEQLYSLRYGTVPVVRATGGLDDTVMDTLAHPDQGTGFKFVDYSADALIGTLTTVIERFKDRGEWHAVMRRGMREDFSWERSAKAYEDIYSQALGIAKEKRDS